MISRAERDQLRSVAAGARQGWPVFSPEVVLALLDALDADTLPDSTDATDAAAESSDLGKKVKAARKARGWTQGTLAERSGLTRVDISRIENGYNKGSSHRIHVALASGFGVDVDSLESMLAPYGGRK